MNIFHKKYFRMPGSIEKIRKKMEEYISTCLSKENIDEITSGGERKVKAWYLTVILMSIKYLAPVVIGVIMVRGLFF
jgi:hypothetical protein